MPAPDGQTPGSALIQSHSFWARGVKVSHISCSIDLVKPLGKRQGAAYSTFGKALISLDKFRCTFIPSTVVPKYSGTCQRTDQGGMFHPIWFIGRFWWGLLSDMSAWSLTYGPFYQVRSHIRKLIVPLGGVISIISFWVGTSSSIPALSLLSSTPSCLACLMRPAGRYCTSWPSKCRC